MKRCGRVTSSALEKLFTGGRISLTGDEYAMAKAAKTRTTIDVEFGETAISYVYELVREKRRNKPTFHRDNYNFEWGHAQEPYAIEWLRTNTMLNIQSCTTDFDEIVFNICACGLGDSPDFYVGEEGIGEIKCPVTESKYEAIQDMTDMEVAEQYSPLQLAGHFMGYPKAKRLYLLIYDGQNDEDAFDKLSPVAPERGKLVVFDREQFEPHIAAIEEKVGFVTDFIQKVIDGEVKVREINDYWNRRK